MGTNTPLPSIIKYPQQSRYYILCILFINLYGQPIIPWALELGNTLVAICNSFKVKGASNCSLDEADMLGSCTVVRYLVRESVE